MKLLKIFTLGVLACIALPVMAVSLLFEMVWRVFQHREEVLNRIVEWLE